MVYIILFIAIRQWLLVAAETEADKKHGSKYSLQLVVCAHTMTQQGQGESSNKSTHTHNAQRRHKSTCSWRCRKHVIDSSLGIPPKKKKWREKHPWAPSPTKEKAIIICSREDEPSWRRRGDSASGGGEVATTWIIFSARTTATVLTTSENETVTSLGLIGFTVQRSSHSIVHGLSSSLVVGDGSSAVGSTSISSSTGCSSPASTTVSNSSSSSWSSISNPTWTWR